MVIGSLYTAISRWMIGQAGEWHESRERSMKWALLVVCLVALNGCDHRVLQPTLALPAPGSPVPAFALALRDSGELRSSELSGHPTILFLWSTHCPTSREALSEYREIHRLYSARGVRVVMLSDDESSAEMALLPRVLTDSAIVGEVALARGRLRKIFDRSAGAPERDTARIEFVLPAYLVIDRDGKVAARSWGPWGKSVRAAVDSLLAVHPSA